MRWFQTRLAGEGKKEMQRKSFIKKFLNQIKINIVFPKGFYDLAAETLQNANPQMSALDRWRQTVDESEAIAQQIEQFKDWLDFQNQENVKKLSETQLPLGSYKKKMLDFYTNLREIFKDTVQLADKYIQDPEANAGGMSYKERMESNYLNFQNLLDEMEPFIPRAKGAIEGFNANMINFFESIKENVAAIHQIEQRPAAAPKKEKPKESALKKVAEAANKGAKRRSIP